MMLGHPGFSWMGLLFLLLLFVPNLLWAAKLPAGYAELRAKESRALLVCERIGQTLTTCCALFFSDFNPSAFTPWSLWLAAAALLMLLYATCWARYFAHGQTLKDVYRPLFGVPVPLATLPVLAFVLLGVYGRVVWMVLSALLLGVGHIGIHLGHARKLGLNRRR